MIESPAGRRFQLGHHEFRFAFSFDDDMNVICSDMNGFNRPASVLGTDQDRFQHRLSARMVHFVRRLIHKASLRSLPSGMRSNKRRSVMIVAAIYRAFCIPMVM